MVPSSGALWAALSWLQLRSLSTEKGQVPFGASVGVVSFLATLGTAGREETEKNHHFQMQFPSKVAPTEHQVREGTLKFSAAQTFIQTRRRRSSRV